MSTTRSKNVTARSVTFFSCSKSKVPFFVTSWGRLMLPKLQTAVSSLLVTSKISVQRLEL